MGARRTISTAAGAAGAAACVAAALGAWLTVRGCAGAAPSPPKAPPVAPPARTPAPSAGSVAAGTLSPIKADEEVVLFPTLARWTPRGDLLVPVHGWIYEPDRDSAARRAAFEGIEETFEHTAGVPERLEEEAQRRLARRLTLFAADDEGGKRVGVRVAGRLVVAGPSSGQGHFLGETVLSATGDAAALRAAAPTTLEASLANAPGREASARVFVPAAPGTGGVALVCDIDDTLKVSNVRDRRALLASTFWEEWRAVEGMPALVRTIADSTRATTVYLTAARWPLQGEFQAFLGGAGCPPGVYVMREFDFSVRDLRFARQGAEAHKRAALRALADALPTHDFVLIGDSTEADPVVYGEFARAHPERTRAVLIRLVGEDRARDERSARAFEGVDSAKVVLFRDAPAFADVAALVAPSEE